MDGDLKVFKFLSSEDRTALVAEKSAYLALCNDIDLADHDISAFRQSASSIPCFQKLASKVSLVQPSSAVVERVFFILRTHIDDKQERALQDVLETTTILNVNENSRQHLPAAVRERLRAHTEAVEQQLRANLL
jgi:hypothetical protein